MNYFQTLKFGSHRLKSSNISTHILDSEILLSFVLNLPRENILINLDSNIRKSIFNNYKILISRRETKEPIAYIINKKEFWKNNFYINNDVLIPRPETEIIVEELDKNLGGNFNLFKLDKIFQVILKSATYEILYKPNVSIKIIIKEYLNASNFFLNESQTKYLNALLDNAAKRLRYSNA